MIWCSGLADNEMLSRFARGILFRAQAVKCYNSNYPLKVFSHLTASASSVNIRVGVMGLLKVT